MTPKEWRDLEQTARDLDCEIRLTPAGVIADRQRFCLQLTHMVTGNGTNTSGALEAAVDRMGLILHGMRFLKKNQE